MADETVAPGAKSGPPDREQLHRILEGLSDGVVLIEPDGEIAWANEAALAMHGCTVLSDLGGTVKGYESRFALKLRDGQPLAPTAYPSSSDSTSPCSSS